MSLPVMLSSRIDGDLKKALKRLSVDTDKNVSTLLEEAIADLLAKYDQQVPDNDTPKP